jgi:hypothetical protein
VHVKDAIYNVHDPAKVAADQKHLIQEQRDDLAAKSKKPIGSHWLTPTGPKPWHKKIKPILALAPPECLKQLCAFIGFVKFYK